MTTIVQFTPSLNAIFSFQPTLDGEAYTAAVYWSLSGRRWYFRLSNLSGQIVFNIPLIGSPADFDISLTAGYFDTTLIYREVSGQFEVGD